MDKFVYSVHSEILQLRVEELVNIVANSGGVLKVRTAHRLAAKSLDIKMSRMVTVGGKAVRDGLLVLDVRKGKYAIP